MTRILFVPLLLTAIHASSASAAPDRSAEVPNAVVAITGKELEKLSSSRDLTSLLRQLPCTAQTVPTFLPAPAPSPTGAGSLTCVRPADIRMVDVLREHNRVRAAFGSQPLVWDVELARGASFYAAQLPARGLVHSPRDSRPRNVRENLQMGLRGQSGYGMTSIWVGESRLFMPGVFPNVSRNGDWASVAHYTQMVWPTTTRLGCGTFPDGRIEWVVCRYSPPGNRDGTVIAPLPPPVMTIADGPAPAALPVTPATQPPEGPPPPPPPPTARDDAPNGDESKHPLVAFAHTAYAEFGRAFDDENRAAQEAALVKLRYALNELKKRLKAARKVPAQFRTVDPAKVEDEVKMLERTLDRAERQYANPEERG